MGGDLGEQRLEIGPIYLGDAKADALQVLDKTSLLVFDLRLPFSNRGVGVGNLTNGAVESRSRARLVETADFLLQPRPQRTRVPSRCCNLESSESFVHIRPGSSDSYPFAESDSGRDSYSYAGSNCDAWGHAHAHSQFDAR